MVTRICISLILAFDLENLQISPEGWQIVAGGCSGAKTTGTNQKDLHHEVVPESLRKISSALLIWHPVGVREFLPALTGGFRFASTTGYFLATLACCIVALQS